MCEEEQVVREEKKYKEIYKNMDISIKRNVFFAESLSLHDSVQETKHKTKSSGHKEVTVIQNQLKERDLNEVDYDMDTFDQVFLDSAESLEIENSEFELIVDRLEKEWFGFVRNLVVGRSETYIAERPHCDICTLSDTKSENELIFCQGCGLCVHQECYGVPYVRDDFWMCRKCIYVGKKVPVCEFCPKTGGAYKKTENFKWVHVLCVLYIKDLSFLNPVFLEPVDLSEVKDQNYGSLCSLCQGKDGVVIECSFSGCCCAYHVTCGIEGNCYYDHSNLLSYCTVHDPTLRTSFWSIEDFYGFDSLSYKSLTKRPLIRKKAKLHKPFVSNLLELRDTEVFCDQDAYSRILGIDLHHLEDIKKKEVLELVGKYWAAKRKLLGRPLLSNLDITFSNAKIASWIKRRKELLMLR